ncbi:MAG: TetR/AcrR family transcriptional regulator [Myxococcota bacterium]
MARPREFDAPAALEQALLVFWRKGYAATTIADLVDATGLGRQSLYNAFGDKRDLFVGALGLYRERIEADLARLRRPGADLEDVRTYVERALQAQRTLGSGACMLVVTAFGPSIEDPEIAKAVRAGGRAVRGAFTELVARAVDAGTVSPSTQPAAAAAMLYSVLNGLSALGRTGGTTAERKQVLDQALESLRR